MATLEAMFMSLDAYSSNIDKVTIKTYQAAAMMLKASDHTDKFDKGLEKAGTSAGKASSGFNKFLKSLVSIENIKKGMGIIDEFTNTSTRLASINDGLQTQTELQNKVFAAADRSRGSYTEMAGSIYSMGIMAKDSFGSNDELIAFAELAQKSFKIGGASAADQSSAWQKLTQAMSAGNLQGEEFLYIMEKAPKMADAIAKFTGKSTEELKKMADEGSITSDIIKNAMFMAANDINTEFGNIPMTFADIWNKIKNGAVKAFDPVMVKINELIKTDEFGSMINRIINVLGLVSGIIMGIIDAALWLGAVINDNWSLIEPVVWGIVGALIAYKTIALVTNGVIAAQRGLNAVLGASPFTLVILKVLAGVAAFYVIIAAINKFAGTSISATGIIIGAFAALAAFIWNIVTGLINAIIQLLWSVLVESVFGVIEFIFNVCMGGFDSFGDGVANLLGKIISWFLGFGTVVTKIIDAIFGSDWTGELEDLRANVMAWGVGKNTISLDLSNAPTIGRIGLEDSWKTGYSTGEKIEDKFSNLFEGTSMDENPYDNSVFNKFSNPDAPLIVEGRGNNGTVEVNMADEDLQYLRDIAERDYINQFSTATLAPSIQMTFGDIHEEADANKVAGSIKRILQEEIATAAEGVYN